jgi:hypothetical protein
LRHSALRQEAVVTNDELLRRDIFRHKDQRVSAAGVGTKQETLAIHTANEVEMNPGVDDFHIPQGYGPVDISSMEPEARARLRQ